MNELATKEASGEFLLYQTEDGHGNGDIRKKVNNSTRPALI